jgi:hypothetical protein
MRSDEQGSMMRKIDGEDVVKEFPEGMKVVSVAGETGGK